MRRRGIPLTMCAVYMAVAEAVGLQGVGMVGLPMHIVLSVSLPTSTSASTSASTSTSLPSESEAAAMGSARRDSDGCAVTIDNSSGSRRGGGGGRGAGYGGGGKAAVAEIGGMRCKSEGDAQVVYLDCFHRGAVLTAEEVR